MKTKVTLNICGLDYTISSDDDVNYVKAIADEVIQSIERIMKNNSKVSTAMAATLAALEYCDAAKKATIGADNLRAQIKSYLEDVAEAKSEIEEKKRQIAQLHFEIKALRLKTMHLSVVDAENKASKLENVVLELKSKKSICSDQDL
ncbi:MAG: cell division protein ZapA [Oscillospiraceae bacterium]|nr:cell division protein ZapA [Oscillospiraceae bacterium]